MDGLILSFGCIVLIEAIKGLIQHRQGRMVASLASDLTVIDHIFICVSVCVVGTSANVSGSKTKCCYTAYHFAVIVFKIAPAGSHKLL